MPPNEGTKLKKEYFNSLFAGHQRKIKALSNAIQTYSLYSWPHFFAQNGVMLSEVDDLEIQNIREILNKVEVDKSGLDANGIDIKGAISILDHIPTR